MDVTCFRADNSADHSMPDLFAGDNAESVYVGCVREPLRGKPDHFFSLAMTE